MFSESSIEAHRRILKRPPNWKYTTQMQNSFCFVLVSFVSKLKRINHKGLKLAVK